MTSDGNWNQENHIETHFEDTRPTCNLLPVVGHPGFKYSANNFPSIIANIHAIENQAQPHETRECNSVVLNDPVAIRLTHHLFVVRWFFYFSPEISYMF
jgi:hypothetical protein